MCSTLPAPQNSTVPKAGLIPAEPRCQSRPWMGAGKRSRQHAAFPPRREEKERVGGPGDMAIDPFVAAERN